MTAEPTTNVSLKGTNMTETVIVSEVIAPRAYAATYASGIDQNAPQVVFCIVGMDDSVWADEDVLSSVRTWLEEQKDTDPYHRALAFQLRCLSLALESGNLHRVTREEAEAIALEWGARRAATPAA